MEHVAIATNREEEVIVPKAFLVIGRTLGSCTAWTIGDKAVWTIAEKEYNRLKAILLASYNWS